MILVCVLLLYLSLSSFWSIYASVLLPLLGSFLPAQLYVLRRNLPVAPLPKPQPPSIAFLQTRRHGFNSFMFVFGSALPSLPSFYSVRLFRLRYLTNTLNYRRFSLPLAPLLNLYSPMFSFLSLLRLPLNSSLGYRKFRRPGRVFFFKRNLFRKYTRVGRSTTNFTVRNNPLRVSRTSLQSSNLWTQSLFRATPSYHTYNLVPFFFLSSRHGSTHSYSTYWIREFRQKVTRFMKLDFKKTVIQYNLKPLYQQSFWLLGNRTPDRLVQNVWSYNFLGFSLFRVYGLGSAPNINTDFLVADTRRSYLYRLRTKRMLTLWVSKVMQRSLTPIRREFNTLHYRKPLRYQHRLTALVLRYYRFRVLEFITALEFSFINVIMRSRFVVLRSVALDFIARRWFLINGVVTTDPSFLVAPLDILQLTPSLRWVFFYKWLLLRVSEDFSRFFYYLRKWRVRANRPYPKESSFRIPD